jgi:oligosaccharide repeat unit polymerase
MILIFSFLIVIRYYNFSISSILSLTDISGLYDIREDFRDQNDEIPKIAVYALTISAKVFIPCLLLYGILRKHKVIIILSFAMQVILFLITGQKSLFLGWLLILGFCLYMRNKETLKINIVANFISFIFLFSIVLYWLGSEALLIFVVRRIFIMPGVLGAYYFDFYLNHPYALLSYSFMSAFFENIYNATPPFVIGMNYFSRSGMSANVNFLMSAFADFSYIGMILYTLILCMIYKFIDLVIDFKSNIRLLSVMLLPTWALLDSSMTTVLLTHGLLVTIMLILFCPIKKVFE